MRNQGQLVIAAVIIIIGVVLLIGNVLDIDAWALMWPSLLILLGLALLLRPQLIGISARAPQRLLGDIRRGSGWQVTDEEFWVGIGDVKLDLTSAEIPEGETHIRVAGLIGDVRMKVPEGVGVSVSSSGLVGGVRLFGKKRDTILTTIRMDSDDYETAERKIRLDETLLVGDVRIERG